MAKLSRIARPQTRFMQSNEIGEVAAEENAYGFNHAVRGYDPEEVDDYINNLFGNYKNTQNVLNKQKEEFETEREMLQCEINDLHGKNGALQEENDELKATIEELREEILALAEGAGLLIEPCNQIHTFGMKFAIDTLTLDKDNVILYIDHEIQPGKIRKMVSKGRRVLELPSGTANKYMLQVGQVISVE